MTQKFANFSRIIVTKGKHKGSEGIVYGYMDGHYFVGIEEMLEENAMKIAMNPTEVIDSLLPQ